MKQVFLFLSFFSFFFAQIPVQAQEVISGSRSSVQETAERDPDLRSNAYGSMSRALWDIQFGYSVADSVGYGALAGVVYLGNEFWVSQWNTDTIFVLSTTGQALDTFTIANVGGIRSMTTDGTNVYAGNASMTIAEIDPTTRSLIGTINSPLDARHCTYDETADGGNGGFWVGNWGTDIVQIDRNGNLLNIIPLATHGLNSMYGSVFDNISPGGPYLWVAYQAGVSSQAEIAQLALPSGLPTGVVHDVAVDFGGGPNDGLAGGLFVADDLIPGQLTIGGILQLNGGIMFGYELDEAVIPDVDVEILDLLYGGYTQYPVGQTSGAPIGGVIRNVGQETIDEVYMAVVVLQDGGLVFTDTATFGPLLPLQGGVLNSSTFFPTSKAEYQITATIGVSAPQIEDVTSNNLGNFSFSVTDSTFARDDNTPLGNGYLVSTTSEGYAAAVFSTTTPDTLTSLYINLVTPDPGTITYPVVFTMSNGVPQTLFTSGDTVTIDANTNEYILKFPPNLILPSGDWAIGVYEGANTGIGLAQSASIYTENTNFFYTPANGWNASGIETARFIRPNFGSKLTTSGLDFDPAYASSIQLYPNPTEGRFVIAWDAAEGADEVRVLGAQGQMIRQIEPQSSSELAIDLSHEAKGIYWVQIVKDGKFAVKSVVIR